MTVFTFPPACRAGTVLLIWAALTWASAATVQGFAHVGDTGVPPTADSAGASTNSGAPIAARAVLGNGSAGFDVSPAAGSGGFSGQSAALSFGEWATGRRETQADGYLKVIDRFHIDGDITGPVQARFIVRMNGELLPNLDFESAYFAATGSATLTARALLNLSFTSFGPGAPGSSSQQLNQVAHWLGAGNPCTPACEVGPTVAMEIVQGFTLGAGERDFGFDITLGAVGLRGGAYELSGADGLSGAGASRRSAAFSDVAAKPFFSIELVLPQGLRYTAEGGHFMQLAAAVPEPAVWQLLVLGLLGLLGLPGVLGVRAGLPSRACTSRSGSSSAFA